MMKRPYSRNMQMVAGQRGAVAILTAVLFMVFLGFAAFAIDLAHLYVVKAELQNAADAAALAGASVLIADNRNCIAEGRPYHCCSASTTGSCDPALIDGTSVIQTAAEVAAKNSSGNSPVPTPAVEIGHYAFASTWGSPGTFTADSSCTSGSCTQLSGWETMTFATLNGNASFINAVKATVTRTDVPRFLSRIWSSTPHSVSVEATAWLGFSGTIPAGVIDAPIAVCESAILTSSNPPTYKCNVGTMLNQGTQTARWTNFTQPCPGGAASANSIDQYACTSNQYPVVLGKGIQTTNGTDQVVLKDIYDRWTDNLNQCSKLNLDTDTPKDGRPDKPWKITIPVIDCSEGNDCGTVTGVAEVNVVWITGSGNDTALDKRKAWYPTKMTNPNPEADGPLKGKATWICDTCTTPQEYWDDFVNKFQLQNNNNTGKAIWDFKTVYFLPDCTIHKPTGGTGGTNYGMMAQYPVLVK